MKKISKQRLLFIIIILFFTFSIAIFSQVQSGLAEIIDPALIGKKLNSGSIYNPDENSCITANYNLLTVLLLENIINGKKTIVYVIDNNPSFKFKDSIIAISSRAAKELGETANIQIAVKITVLKEGITTTSQTSSTSQTTTSSSTIPTTTSSVTTPTSTTSTTLTPTQTQTATESQQTTQIPTSKEMVGEIPIYTSGKQTKNTYYYIQVGAFKNKDNAIAIALKLRSLGYKVFIYFNQLYKVCVGPYSKHEEAIEVRKILSGIFINDKPFVFSSNLLFE